MSTWRGEIVEDMSEFQGAVTDVDGGSEDVVAALLSCICRVSAHHLGTSLSGQ